MPRTWRPRQPSAVSSPTTLKKILEEKLQLLRALDPAQVDPAQLRVIEADAQRLISLARDAIAAGKKR